MKYIISKERRAIIVSGDEKLPALIPTAKPLDYKGKRLWAVPFELRETIQLRSLGFAVPSPIGSYYGWPRELSKVPQPFASQIETAAFFTLNKRAYCLSEMGVGKTMAALWSADYLMSIGAVRKVLIISPISTLDRTWHDSIFEHLGHRSAVVLHGTAAKRKKLFANDAFDMFIINHDGVDIITERVYKDVKGQRKLVDAKLMRDDIDLIIIDELAVMRNHNTTRWRVLDKIIRPEMRVFGLTGAPTPNAPTDAYAQIKLLTPERVAPYFTSFRQAVMQQLTEYQWVPRKGAAETVHAAMQPSIRYARKDCMDLPPCTYSTREVALSDEQTRHYKELLKDSYTEIAGGKISAANQGVMLSKLLQVACGAAYDKEGKTRAVDMAPRITEVKNIVEQAAGKVLIFVPFRAALEAIHAELSKSFECAVIHGGVSRAQRSAIFTEFEKGQKLRVIIADAGAMSHGLTLVSADTIIWFSAEMSHDTYIQACARITRPGQKRHQHIIHISGTTLEKRLFARLEQRASTQNILLQLAEEGAPA